MGRFGYGSRSKGADPRLDCRGSVCERGLPLDQCHAPVLRSSLLRIVGCDWGVQSAAERVQAIGCDLVLRAQLSGHAGGAAAAEVQIVVGFPLVVGVAHDVNLQLWIRGQELSDLLKRGL